MRKVSPIVFLLALTLCLVAFAGVSWSQSDLQYQTCPENNAGIVPLDSQTQPIPVPTDIAVDVVFNQNINLITTGGITMTAVDENGNLTDLTASLNPRVRDNILWLFDPNYGDNISGAYSLPPNQTIHVHIPAGCVTAINGSPLSQDIDFSFKTGDSEDHYIFNFVTPVQTQQQQHPILKLVKQVDNRSDDYTRQPGDFTLYVADDSGKVVKTATGSADYTFTDLPAGRYRVSERAEELGGYTPSFSGDCDSSGVFTLTDGVTTTVTVLNTSPSGGGGNSNNPSGPGTGPGPGPNNPSPVPPPGLNTPPTVGPIAAPPPGTAPKLPSPFGSSLFPPQAIAAPPPGTAPKLPKTGVDPGGVNVPWPIPACLVVIALLSLAVVERKHIFSSRQ